MSKHKATIVMGRTVIVERKDSETSIPVENPAVITRHHGGGVINCRMLEDGHHIPWLRNIPKKHKLGPNEVQPLYCWFWPPRSPAARAESEAERRDTGEFEPDPPSAGLGVGPVPGPRSGPPTERATGQAPRPGAGGFPGQTVERTPADETDPMPEGVDKGVQDHSKAAPRYDPTKEEAKAPADEEKSGPSLPPTGYRP